ncbi:hypothetical protein Cadr_000012868 [Camelus dromedarius]|uniref:Uncharacterized protein n=1 Tax=Camelus dromedarius TaxID=9838 RepID=A0A5N4D8S7_CAMDR|nr:hypothetical protein Cadr_000012868 [Camelus dromedarius]
MKSGADTVEITQRPCWEGDKENTSARRAKSLGAVTVCSLQQGWQQKASWTRFGSEKQRGQGYTERPF